MNNESTNTTNQTEVIPESIQEQILGNNTDPVVSHHEPTEKEKQVVPELVFHKLLGVFLKNVAELSREQAIRVLAQAVSFPLEHEKLPKIKGKHAKLAFQSAVRMFDAKLLMFYNYMKQAETSSVETIDGLVKELLDKKEQLLKLSTEAKTEEDNANVS